MPQTSLSGWGKLTVTQRRWWPVLKEGETLELPRQMAEEGTERQRKGDAAKASRRIMSITGPREHPILHGHKRSMVRGLQYHGGGPSCRPGLKLSKSWVH
jgi:hypothetical protein